MFPPKRFDMFSPLLTGRMLRSLDAFRFFFKLDGVITKCCASRCCDVDSLAMSVAYAEGL